MPTRTPTEKPAPRRIKKKAKSKRGPSKKGDASKKVTKRTKRTPMAKSSKASGGQSPKKNRAKEVPDPEWEALLDRGHFLRVPKVVFQLFRWHPRDGTKWADFQPRHLVLLLSLQARKYKGKEIRAYWEEISRDLGVGKSTVRKWAYELEKMGLLKIKRYKKREEGMRAKPGQRNDNNGFVLRPFIDALNAAEDARIAQKDKKNGEGDNDGN